MNDVIKYKGFIGKLHFSANDEVFNGRLEGINDLVTFEGQTVEELKSAMEEAVEDYVDICKRIGKDPMKSYKGSFNVRVDPKLHLRAAQKSTEEGISLNQLVEEAMEEYLTTK